MGSFAKNARLWTFVTTGCGGSCGSSRFKRDGSVPRVGAADAAAPAVAPIDGLTSASVLQPRALVVIRRGFGGSAAAQPSDAVEEKECEPREPYGLSGACRGRQQ